MNKIIEQTVSMTDHKKIFQIIRDYEKKKDIMENRNEAMNDVFDNDEINDENIDEELENFEKEFNKKGGGGQKLTNKTKNEDTLDVLQKDFDELRK